jgi:zinc protease
VQAVTVEQVQAAAAKWIRASGRVQVTYRRQEAAESAASETAGEQA